MAVDRVCLTRNLLADGWQPIDTAPELRLVQLLLHDAFCGTTATAGAFLLKDHVWHSAEPFARVRPTMAIGWRPWMKNAAGAALRDVPQLFVVRPHSPN